MTQGALDLLVTAPLRSSLRDRVLVLRSVENFFGLDEEALTLLAEQARARLYKAGDVLAAPGAPPESIHVIVEGQVTIARKKSPLVMRGGGGVGVLAVLAGAPTRGAVADVDTRTLEIPVAAFLIALEENFSILRNSLRMMGQTILQSRGSLPADPKHPPEIEVGIRYARPKTLAERLVELRQGFWTKLNLDAVIDLARIMVEVRVPAGHVFWSVGDAATSSLHIDYGRVRCTAADGSSMIIGANFTLGVMDVLAAKPHSYGAVAETEIIGHVMNREDFLVILEMHAQVGLELVRSLARDMIDTD